MVTAMAHVGETQICTNCGVKKLITEFRLGSHGKPIGKCEACLTKQREARMRERGKTTKKSQGDENSTRFLDWMGTSYGIYW